MARRLVVGALALALLAGCTSIAGTPGAEEAAGSEGASAGEASAPSSLVPVGEPDSALTTLAGELTMVVTKNVVDGRVLENWGKTTIGRLAGSLSGTFTDDTLGCHGSEVMMTAVFEYSAICN